MLSVAELDVLITQLTAAHRVCQQEAVAALEDDAICDARQSAQSASWLRLRTAKARRAEAVAQVAPRAATDTPAIVPRCDLPFGTMGGRSDVAGDGKVARSRSPLAKKPRAAMRVGTFHADKSWRVARRNRNQFGNGSDDGESDTSITSAKSCL